MLLKVGEVRVLPRDEVCAVTQSTYLVRFLKVTTVAGMSPYTVVNIAPGQHSIKTNARLTLYSWIFTLGMVTTYTFTLYMEVYTKKVRTVTVRLVKLLEYVFINGCTLSCLLTLRGGTPRLMEFLTCIRKVDECFGDRRFERNERSTLVGLVLLICAAIVIVLQEFLDDVSEHKDMKVLSVLLDIPYLGSYLLVVVLQCKSVFLSHMLCSRASAINVQICKVSYRDDEGRQEVEILHYQQILLRRAARALDCACGLVNTAAVIFCIIGIIVSIYYTIADLEVLHINSMIINIQWIAIHTASLVILVEPCHKYTAEDLAMSRELEKLVLRMEMAHSSDCHRSSDRRLAVFWRQRPSFRAATAALTAVDICPLHRQLLLSIISTVTTYLIILLQVKDSDINS